MSVETLLLESRLKQLGLTTFIRNHAPFAVDAAQNQYSYARYLLALAEQEVAQREANSRQRRLKEAKLPIVKQLSDFDFAAIPTLNQQQLFQLAQGDYIRQREPVILVGNPGLGKTHIATGLAVEACRQHYRVRFYNTAALVNELLAAQQAQQLAKVLAAAQRHHLLVLDRVPSGRGFIPLTATGAQLLFQFCSALYERVALIVTTNLKFADWTQIFGDERLTLALLDRLTHKAHILEFTGESYRFRQQRQRVSPRSELVGTTPQVKEA
ncbi:MAG: IS21-like element helper ATPase IstB [Caldilineaceae bacterium]|nr:IS21-like element helper ATPase IstB [Caldilineaceae bacterium]